MFGKTREKWPRMVRQKHIISVHRLEMNCQPIHGFPATNKQHPFKCVTCLCSVALLFYSRPNNSIIVEIKSYPTTTEQGCIWTMTKTLGRSLAKSSYYTKKLLLRYYQVDYFEFFFPSEFWTFQVWIPYLYCTFSESWIFVAIILHTGIVSFLLRSFIVGWTETSCMDNLSPMSRLLMSTSIFGGMCSAGHRYLRLFLIMFR